MAGYPTRFTRQVLGPDLRDAYRVENPEIEVPARALNSAFHQLAGLNLTSFARALLIAEHDGSSWHIHHQEEAWNSKRLQPHPTLDRSAAGVYTYTFSNEYADELAVMLPTSLVGCRAWLMAPVVAYANRREIFAWIDPAAPLVVEVRIFDSSGTGQDEPFILEVA